MTRPYGCKEVPARHSHVALAERTDTCKVAEKDVATSNAIIAIAQKVCGAGLFESVVDDLFCTLSQSLRPSRIWIYGLNGESQEDLFEWHAEGQQSLQGVRREMAREWLVGWESLFERDAVFEVTDRPATALPAADDSRIQETLRRIGLKRALVAPLRNDGGKLGFLCVENQNPAQGIDAMRLVGTVAPFIGTRMECQRVMRELELAGQSDVLTGLLNRRGIHQAAKETLNSERNAPYALVLIDIDDFKVINDLCGHEIGDKALQSLAQTLEQTFPEGTVLGRNGGDEFLALLIGENSTRVATILGNLERRDLSIDCDEKKYPLSLSIGYVESYQVTNLQQAMSKADAALYAVKLAGKAGFRKYEDEMQEQRRTQLGFTHRDIAENIPGAVAVYRPADGEILYANDELLQLVECVGLDDLLAFTGGYFSGIMHPNDRERAWGQLKVSERQGRRQGKAYAEFRIITKSGKSCDVCSTGKYTVADGIGEVCYDLITGQNGPLGG